jgi:hypothetical protein
MVQQRLRRMGSLASGTPVTPVSTDAGFWTTLVGRPSEQLPTSAEVKPAQFGGLGGYPSGGRQVASADGINIDLRNNSAAGPGVAETRLFAPYPIATDVTGIFNSMFMIADDDTKLAFVPGYGEVNADACGFYSFPVKGVQSIRIYGDRPFVFSTIFNSQESPVTIGAFASHQERWASQTITKTNGAGVADTYTYVHFSSSNGKTQMDPATYGATSIHTGSIAQKDFIVTAATNDVDVIVQELHVSGKTWANSSATGGGTPLTAADTLNLQMGSYSHLIRMGIRVQAAAAAAQTSAITVQYRGYGGSF